MKRASPFVPASGAASRMFKDLFAFLDADYDVPTTEFEKAFFSHLPKFAFVVSLDEACRDLYGKDSSMLCSEGQYKQVVEALLYTDGLDYGNMPKGLLLFHTYQGNRTAVGEHLHEGALCPPCRWFGEVHLPFRKNTRSCLSCW